MSDSNITKKALASSLKELMDEMPFQKIQIAQICERCGMNRKSFYYHFKDKYDLLNWIFDTDTIPYLKKASQLENFDQRIEVFTEICECFYKNRTFYYKALKIEGQNSLRDHFREFLFPLLKLRVTDLVPELANDDFTINFFVDAMSCTMQRWLLSDTCMPADQFVNKLTYLLQKYTTAINRQFGNND